ncbi:photoreceptor disk component PRCD isoform X1 [Cebus imitator]|uniref:photoreceptor disk component PRCD isoform X1 n=1 Tax=Cebus imitator TaxID=2715852 RepID=UPI00189AE43A|nr:photoreceptor disk component PRCD isoform X1 [Cebus imitator]
MALPSVLHFSLASSPPWSPSWGGSVVPRDADESPATWMGQLGPAAWTQTLRPHAAQVLVRPLVQEDAVGAGAAARGRMGESSTKGMLWEPAMYKPCVSCQD